MIECAGRDFSPIFRRVTFFAVSAESAAMRILMARDAVRKRQAGVLGKFSNCFFADFFTRHLRRMAFAAGDVLMPAGEHELRTVV